MKIVGGWLAVPEEVAFFGRSAVFGLVIGAVYWFLSYEEVGTLLLLGFGIATGVAFLVLRASVRPPRGAPSSEAAGDADEPFTDEGGLVPLASAAPLWVGLGLGIATFSLAYGLWFLLAGLLPFLLGASDWLASAVRAGNAKAHAPHSEQT